MTCPCGHNTDTDSPFADKTRVFCSKKCLDEYDSMKRLYTTKDWLPRVRYAVRNVK